MPSPVAGQKIIQVQLDAEKVQALDDISRRTYVPRAILVRMAIDNFLAAAAAGQIQMGISMGSTSPVATGGQQPTFSVVPPPPPVDPTKT